MKNILKVTLFVSVLILFASCDDKNKKEDKFSVLGEVSGFPDGTKFYLRNLTTDAVFDSAVITNNKFKFEGQLFDTPEQIWLNAKVDKKFVYTNLLIGNDDIKVVGDISDFPWNVKITGSKSQDDFNYSRGLTKEYDIERDSLVQFYFKLSKEEQEKNKGKVWRRIKKIDSATEDLRIKYIKSHPDTYISVIDLGYLKKQLSKDTIQKIFDKYTPEIKNSKYAKIVEVYLREKISKVGDKYHDFEALNQNDEKVKFSKIKGEYTLLDFTAAYCGPCIKAAEELVEINKTYSDSLNIISFSGDSKKDVWLKSLKRDKVTWNSLWDGKGRYSETSIKYGVQGYPTFLLINPEGVIIDRWSGYGEGSLKKKLKKNIDKN